MTTQHRPLTIRQRQGTGPDNRPRGEWMTLCECGWTSDWDHRHWRVHTLLAEHFASVRVPG